MIKTKDQRYWGKLARNRFALPPPPILNRVKNELADSRPVKTCIVTIIILENMFWNIKSPVFTYGGKGNSAAELACLQMLNISLRKIFIYLLYLRLEQS